MIDTSERSTPPTPKRDGECSAFLRFGLIERCANGFPVNAGCVGIGVPFCCNERVCGRLYPDTGKPQWCPL